MKIQFYQISLTLCIIILICSACTSKKDKLIQKFNELDGHVVSGNFTAVIPELDSASLSYYKEITDTSNLSFNKILEIARHNELNLLSLFFFHQFGNHMKVANRSADFFKFLAIQGVPWFSYYDEYDLVRKRTRVGKENYVTISKSQNGHNYIYWLRFTENNSGGYQFNLIDLLLHQERELNELLVYRLRQNNESVTREESYLVFWNHLGPIPGYDANLYDLDFDKLERLKRLLIKEK